MDTHDCFSITFRFLATMGQEFIDSLEALPSPSSLRHPLHKSPPLLYPPRGALYSLCQFCANLIGTSWHLVAQHATSVSASLIKLRVNKLHSCFGSRGSEVQILSPRPFKTMGYGLGRSPFFVVASTGASVWYGMGDSLPPLPKKIVLA